MPHFVWAVCLCNGPWQTEKPPLVFPTSGKLLPNVESLNEARTPLANFFSILLVSGLRCPGSRRPWSISWKLKDRLGRLPG